MSKLHHKTLSAAIKLYSVFYIDGKSEDEIKEAIAKDPKDFDDEAIHEIYQAILDGKSEDEINNNPKEYSVIKPFRDKANFNYEYQIGENVSHLEKSRIDHLVKHGHVEEL